MMVIVPESTSCRSTRAPANEIDQVHKGQNTLVRFSAFNQRTTPELSGIVFQVSADVTATRNQTRIITLCGSVCQEANSRALASSDSFQECGRGLHSDRSRTMMSYLFKPISDQLHRMFRER